MKGAAKRADAQVVGPFCLLVYLSYQHVLLAVVLTHYISLFAQRLKISIGLHGSRQQRILL